MRLSTKLSKILILLLLTCLMWGCRGAQDTASNQNTSQNTAQTTTAGETPDDISGSSEITKSTPRAAANTLPPTTPKPSKPANASTAKARENEEPADGEGTDNVPNKNDTAVSVKYILGPRGNCFFLNENGKRVFVSKSLCGKRDEPNIPGRNTSTASPADPRQYTLGPKGKCYYINSAGVKIVVPKGKCN